MKRFLTAFLLLLSVAGSGARAGEPFFCTQPGRTLYYERTRAEDGRLERTTTLNIVSVRTDEDAARRVDYGFVLRSPGGKDLYGGRVLLMVRIDADGSVCMNLGASLASVIAAKLPGSKPVSGGETSVLPADMQPGDRLPEAHCTVDAGALHYTIDVTERSVLRAERITTPAGTFDCLVVHEHKVERGPMRHRDTWSDSWYAPGVGYVRHDTYDKNHRLDTTEILKKY